MEFAGLMTDLNVGEDESEAFEFEIINVGNVDAKYELVVETNLGDRLADKQGLLASGETRDHSLQRDGPVRRRSRSDGHPGTARRRRCFLQPAIPTWPAR